MSDIHIEELPWAAPHELFHAFAEEPYALLLDSATAGPRQDPSLHGRWSFIALDPFETLTARTTGATDAAPFARLKARLAEYAMPDSDPALPPFTGGAAGFFGYDLARSLETLPPREHPFAVDNRDLPDMALGLYDTVAAFDMIAKRALLISTGIPEKNPDRRRARRIARADALRARLARAASSPTSGSCPSAVHLTPNFTRAGYERAVRRVVDYIRAGDIFQANLSQRFDGELGAGDTPYGIYLRLRAQSPAPFASFFNFADGTLVSSSPERFLFVRARKVETKPIKGTRPRGGTIAEDTAFASALLASDKDRAENVMIVDLLRNDLSRVSADHSVEVEKLCALESFANVHHLVSTVRAQLREDETGTDLLAACFPGGSITGAPKLRAMEIIAELEPTTRGPYCGAIGYLGFDGTMDTSIAIRTMLIENGRVSFQAGGGITAASDPAAEYEETLTKAHAMMKALGANIEPEAMLCKEEPA